MTKKSLLTIALLASLSAPTFADSFDSRSLGMGGVGVSSSDYLAAPFHNPALVAKYDETDDVAQPIATTIQLTFTELTPIFRDNYNEFKDLDDVGY